MLLKISNVDSTTGGRRQRSQSEQRGPGSAQGNADPPPATATTWFICRWSASRAPRPLSLLVNTYDDESTSQPVPSWLAGRRESSLGLDCFVKRWVGCSTCPITCIIFRLHRRRLFYSASQSWLADLADKTR